MIRNLDFTGTIYLNLNLLDFTLELLQEQFLA